MREPPPIAIVTGGSRGLGRNTVLSLAKRGVHSIFTYRSNRTEAARVVSLVGEAGARSIALQLDIKKVSDFDSFVGSVRDAPGRLGAQRFDYLVNNAGTSHHNAFEKTTEAELDGLYEVHFKGVFFLIQKLLPLMNDGGRIYRGPDPDHHPGKRLLCVDEGGHRSADAIPRAGTRPATDRGQRGCAWCDRD